MFDASFKDDISYVAAITRNQFNSVMHVANGSCYDVSTLHVEARWMKGKTSEFKKLTKTGLDENYTIQFTVGFF